MMEFLISQELPKTEFLPMMALPRMNAQWRISAPWSMMQGAPMYALGKTLASFATHTPSSGWSYSSAGRVAPSSRMKDFSSFSTSHG